MTRSYQTSFNIQLGNLENTTKTTTQKKKKKKTQKNHQTKKKDITKSQRSAFGQREGPRAKDERRGG